MRSTAERAAAALIQYTESPYWHSVSCVCPQCIYADTMIGEWFCDRYRFSGSRPLFETTSL